MKKMLLTGIGSEQRFDRASNGEGNGYEKLGAAEYYLVFNDGELRVLVSEEAAHIVVQHMYSAADFSTLNEEETGDQPDSPTESNEDDSGFDEDGIDQI